MQVINTNVMSMNSQRVLGQSNNALSTSIERLSSGLRINSAKDDAAGLAISERMTSQINGMNQAVRNANDGVSLAQTAEGALQQVTDNMQRIRELSVQAANATNSDSDRAALQNEVDQLSAEINRVAEQTSFNNISLLDGSFSSQVFQVGANNGETVTVDGIVDARTATLGRESVSLNGTQMGATGTAGTAAPTGFISAETNLTVATVDGGTSSSISYASDAGADAIAAAINSGASGVGVTATATNSATLSSLDSTGTYSFTLSGGTGSAALSGISVTDQNDLSEVVNAINGASSSTGVTASFTTSGDKSAITLSTTDGSTIGITDFNSTAAGGETVDFSGSTLTQGAADSNVKVGTVELTSTQGQVTLAGGNADVVSSTTSSLDSLAAVDVSTASGARDALLVVDASLDKVNAGRADLGAVQNRFESVVASLQTASENLTASRSRIQDADFAKETAALTRAQILQQAGTAMLAQANQAPQSVLSLLR